MSSGKWSILLPACLFGFLAMIADAKEGGAVVKHEFQDVVRAIEAGSSGRYQVTFQKHAARYSLGDAKPDSPLVRSLEDGKRSGKEVRVTVDAKTLQIIAVK